MTFPKLMTSAAVLALLSGPALAQDTTPDPDDPGAGTTYIDPVTPAPLYTSINEMTVGDMIGMVAYGPDGDRIGEIDYVVPYEDGHAGVIGIGGFLGLGEYTVALPLEDFQLAPEGASFTLDTDKETLEQTPEFDESGAESLPDETPVADLLNRDAPAPDAEPMSDDMGAEGAAVGDTQTGGAEAAAGKTTEGAMTGDAADMAIDGDADASGEAEADLCAPGVIDAECADAGMTSEGDDPAKDSN